MTAALLVLVRQIAMGLRTGIRILGGDPNPAATPADVPGLHAHFDYRPEWAPRA